MMTMNRNVEEFYIEEEEAKVSKMEIIVIGILFIVCLWVLIYIMYVIKG